MRTLRRQNVSCDTCRHAKRRCPAQSGASRHPPAACSRCLRLDLPCTWRFVTAHATAKLLVETSTCGSDGNPGRDGGTDRTQISSKLNGSGCPSSPQREVSDTRAPQVELSTVNSHDLAADADTDRGQPKEYPTRRPDLRISVNTSLDRAFASSVLVEKQSAHHQQVLSWCKDRFLAQQSNPFRPTGGYLLIPEALDEARPDQAAAVFADPVYRLTMFQVARLLDEFAELYGNPLKTRHLRDAQKAQEAVLQAWSMQWFVAREASRREGSAPEDQHRRTCSDDMLESMRHRDMYSAYWWRAHRMLADSKGSSSFTRILAVFMFHTAAVPDGAASQLSLGDTPFDLLTRALLQMQALLRLLHVFTDRLPSSSRYRSLLECAASIVHWYGYMRDTSASMLSARTPTLPQALISDEAVLEDSDGKVARVQRGDNTTAADIEAAHHRLASKTIILWREVVHLRDLCSDGSLDPISTVAALSSCLSSAAASESNVRDLELGLSDRVPVRRASVAACTHILLSWNYGVLEIVRQARAILSSNSSDEDGALLSAVKAIESGVVRSMSIVAAKFALADEAEDVDTPLVAQNSNLPLVVQILTAFIDHAVGRFTAAHGSNDCTTRPAMNSDQAREYISNLLSSLSRLNGTIHSSSLAVDALQALMSRHSDVLMEIWLDIRQPRRPGLHHRLGSSQSEPALFGG